MLTHSKSSSSGIRQKMMREAFQFGDWELHLGTGEILWSNFIFEFFELPHGEMINLLKSNTYYSAEDTLRMNSCIEKTYERKVRSEGIFKTFLPSGIIAWQHSVFNPILDELGNVVCIHVSMQDITKQILLGSKSIEHNFAYNDLINQLHEIVFQLDEFGCIRFMNAAWEKITGYTQEETLGRNLQGWIHTDDISQFSKNCSDLAKNATERVELELRIVNRDGEIVWVKFIAKISESDILSSRISGTMLDITDQRESNNILFQQRLAIENSREGIAIMNGQDQYTYLNKAHVELFGYSEESELLGQSWTFIYPPDEIERISTEVFPEFIAKGYYQGLTRGLKKDGTFIYQDICLTALPDGGIICIARDISDIVKKNQELQQLAIVAEKTNSIVIITDSIGRVEWVNSSFTELSEYTLEELYGRTCEMLHGPETNMIEIEKIVKAISNATSYHGEILNYSKSGKPYWLLLDLTPVFDAGLNVVQFVSVQNDITSHKTAEKNTQAALEKERMLNQFKSHFINLASHEFRTPLATIQSSMDILNLRISQQLLMPDDITKSFTQHHNRIEQEIKWMTEVMNNILVLGKTDAGRMMLKRKKICCNELLNDLINDKASLSNGNDEFSFKVTGEPFFMHLDPQLMRHVLYNLLSNASKYSKGSAQIPEVHAHYSADELHIKFRDYGIGIPEDEIQYLFTSFYRASNTINIHGIGLGLVIVKQLIELHGGTVSVESTFGSGAQFTIILPKQHSEHEENFNS